MQNFKAGLIGLVIGALVTVLAFHIKLPSGDVVQDPSPEYQPAPEERLADESLVLEKVVTIASKPATVVIAGEKYTKKREATITVQSPVASCPDVALSVDVVENDKGVSRLVASSPTGHVLVGTDRLNLVLPRVPESKWLAGGGLDRGKPAIAFGKEIAPNVLALGAISGTSKSDLSGSIFVLWMF